MNKDEEQEMKSLKSYFNRAASWLGRAAARLGFEMGPVMKLETLILDRDELVKTQLRVAFLNSLKGRVEGELGSLIDEALNNGFKNGHDEWEKLTARHTEHGARILRQMEPSPLSGGVRYCNFKG